LLWLAAAAAAAALSTAGLQLLGMGPDLNHTHALPFTKLKALARDSSMARWEQ
jgi:hypothetical protein